VGLIEDLGTGPVGVDTSVFIYLIEEEPRYLPVVEPLFAEADSGSRELVTSALTLLEVLVIPYRSGDHALAERYDKLLTHSRGVRVVDVSREQLRDAARLRARTNIKTPDALQLTAAVTSGCIAFVTNARRLPSVGSMRILQLKDYLRAR